MGKLWARVEILEDDMRILAMFLGVLAFMLSDYLADTIPLITIMDHNINSRLIFMPIFFFGLLALLRLFERYRKNSGKNN